MPTINSYRSAESWFYQHEKGGVARLEPRKPHVRIEQADNAFNCMLYGTCMVQYWEDGLISLQTHDSATSRAFLNNVVPPGVTAFSEGGQTYFKIRLADGSVVYSGQGITKLRISPKGLELIEMPLRESRVKIEAHAKEAQALLQPFLDWQRSVRRLRGSDSYVLVPEGPIAILRDQSRWVELLDCSYTLLVRSVAKALRVAVFVSAPLDEPPRAKKITLCGVTI